MKSTPISPSEIDQCRLTYQRIYCNFIQRAITYEVENKVNTSARSSMVPMTEGEATGQLDEESFKTAVNAEFETSPDSQLTSSQTSASHQTKGKLSIRSVSDLFINQSPRVEELQDKVIKYNKTEVLKSEDILGTNFELDESMSDCRSIYCK